MAELSRADKKQLDESYEFGSTTFWDSLEESKGKNLDPEAVGMEILYQAVHFLEVQGWTEDEILKYVKDAHKDAIANHLYQQELSKVKTAHRQAGELTDKERADKASETKKKILKEADPVALTEGMETEDLAAAQPEAADMN